MFRFLPLIALLCIAFLLALGLFLGRTPEKSPMIGLQVAPFSVPVLGNAAQTLSPERWKGRVVVINVFASWCVPCASEHALLMKLAQSGVDIVGVAWKDKEMQAAGWLAERGNPYRLVGIDEFGATTVPLGLTGVPETYVVARDGAIAWHHKSPLTEEMLDGTLRPMIEHLKKANAR